MRPVVVAVLEGWLGRWAGWLVPNFLVMLGLGCLLGALLLVGEAGRWGYARRETLGVAMVAYAAGLAGAAAVPAAQGLWVLARTGVFRPPSGIAAYGGLLGGVGGAVAWLRWRRRAVLPFLDAAAPAVGLGYFLGRIGCFLAGCDYGKVTTASWGVRFPAQSHAFRDHLARGWVAPEDPWSLPVHPTQLYLAFTGLALHLALSSWPSRGDGRRFLAYVAGYGLLRSLIELLRGDEGRGVVGALSTSQGLAAASIVLAAVVVRSAKQP
jgi:phosphatidylglycerol:prolipoprotein diacylglycerol transferase